ncbi:MAG: IclR family transcriptional regulator [Solirubrobacteraceae bacterium]
MPTDLDPRSTPAHRGAPVHGDRRELASVARAMRLLEILAHEPDAGVTELAQRLQVAKASVDRLLTTLAAAGFVERDAHTRRYRLTLKIAVLADGVRSRTGIVQLARPHLHALSERVQEAANLGVFLDGALVYADTIPSASLFRIEARPGTTLPAYCTAAGKALLAFMSPEQLDNYLDGLDPVRHTRSTLTTTAKIRTELKAIRRAGYAIDRGELLDEAWCVAAPVLGERRLALAAVSATAPRSHFEAKRDDLISAVIATARDISGLVAAA